MLQRCSLLVPLAYHTMPASQAKGTMLSAGEGFMAPFYYGTLISRTLPFLKSRPSVPTLSLRK